eukprot:CAMPEP_0184425448 /NCGR_PEP_ID=MMETSP0738-20130409/133147_1 /TAXON_ID=385413 /ORGANISM="Thalassiosira miniscula, Strain CCMP1093" /LENGTH=31 /DNA_ID= /DNA_START= /DNA_END= /DNA_ORIENTATION=
MGPDHLYGITGDIIALDAANSLLDFVVEILN